MNRDSTTTIGWFWCTSPTSGWWSQMLARWPMRWSCWRWTRSACRPSRTYAWTSSVGWGTRPPPAPIRTPACVAEVEILDSYIRLIREDGVIENVDRRRAAGAISVTFSEHVRKRRVVDGFFVRRSSEEHTSELQSRGN